MPLLLEKEEQEETEEDKRKQNVITNSRNLSMKKWPYLKPNQFCWRITTLISCSLKDIAKIWRAKLVKIHSNLLENWNK